MEQTAIVKDISFETVECNGAYPRVVLRCNLLLTSMRRISAVDKQAIEEAVARAVAANVKFAERANGKV